ncbi:restriction endonuclease subunit S [Streptomyces sp. NPDC127074]|uniref:restriction endonuclease subunit S n=1 Tax=Streptomyces sp. NPDC127074 TaxID=3347130 RepID=UPI00364A1778
MTSKVLSLRRLFRIVNGGTPTPDAENWGGDIPWATPADFGETFGPLRTTHRSLTRRGVDIGSTIVPKGAILLSTRAPIGYVAISEVAMAFNQGCRALVPTANVDSRFFGYQLESARESLQAQGLGTTFLELSSSTLAQIPVLAPSLEEQRRIADFLDSETARIDGIADLRRRQYSTLEERRESYLRRTILAIEAPPTQIKRLGVTVTTGPFGTQFSASDYVEGGVPMVNTAHIRDGVVTPDPRHAVSQETATRLARHLLKAGDIIVARKRHLGRSALITNNQDGWLCGSDSIALSTTGGKLLPEFLACLLRSSYVRMQLLRNSLAATIPNLNERNLLELQVPAASVRDQKSFVELIDASEAKNAALSSVMNRQVFLLAERRQALITAAVTGQIDVSTASGRGIEE